MLSPKFPRVLRYVLIGLVPAAAALVIGCPFGDQTGSNGDSPGKPEPPDDIELEVMIEGQGTVEQEANGSFVTLTAVPDAGWYFQQWFGTTASEHSPLTVQATEDTSIGALFLEGESQADTDSDGVTDGLDQCPDTPSGAEVDENGCAASQQDSDGDGVTDDADQCPGTATGSVIDGQGCAANQRDSDGDGVKDDVDRCSNTSAGASVDALGCTEGQRDNDGDGVANDLDQCPDTSSGTSVDNVGCPLCGNGVVDAGEECDNGSDNSDTVPNACRTNCTSPRCGDGVVDDGEDCDPPNTSTCDSACKFIPPDNDDCDDATAIGDDSEPFSNERAGTDGPDEGGECAGLEGDVWFCYTATCNGSATVSLCNSDFDTVMAVYAGCACPPAGPIKCDDDGCGTQGEGSEVTFTVSDDALYLIRVGGFNGATGSGTLAITCQADGGNGGECQGDNDCDDDVDCTDDACVSGTCVFTENNANCPDDGLFCNGNEVCDGTNDCVSTGDPCPSGTTCNEDTDNCDECQTGADCDDEVNCTDDTCVSGTCVFTANDANCQDDGLFCTGDEVCDAVNDCVSTGDPCTGDTLCHEDSDSCVACLIDDDCDDGDLCTDDECIGNECQYTDKECPQGEYCNPASGICVECLNADHCDNGLWCDGAETCDAQAGCQAGGNPCPGRYCNEDTDTCYDCELHSECYDDLFCNGAETCVDGFCQVGADPCPGQNCNEDNDHCVITCTTDADCDDGLYCNGEEVCIQQDSECITLDPPCIDEAHCDEENDACWDCISDGECDDDDPCTDDACIDNECLNIDVQCAPGVCNPVTGECVDCLDNADCQNGLFCDGDEWCSPTLECQPGEDPCDDGIGCTIDGCDELNDLCVNTATDARCADNGLFCDGDEYCNPVSDCTSTGNPCQADETCNEELDRCEVDPATWVSTQLLFPGFPGYKAPELHELDGVRDLVVAHFGLSESTLRETWPNATIEVYTSDVLLGVETDMYQVVNDPDGPLEETIVQTVTINAFHLSIRGSTATWSFDYIVVNYVDNPFGESVTSGQFAGEQTGDITGARDEITWTGVDGSFQRCTDGNCGPEKPLEELIPTGDWTLGTWTKQE